MPNQSRPTFDFCRTYDGSEPASRWLKRLEFELRGDSRSGIIAPEHYLSSVDLLLVGDAADWAESSPEISTLFAGSHTSESLDRFLSLFKERFPTKSIETIPTTFSEELEGLHQNAEESLTSYYQRTIQITYRFGARDRLPGGPPLSILESSILDLIYSAFLKGLQDLELRREAIRGTVTGISLHSAFVSMEQAHKSRLVIRKIEYEEVQSREAIFYKDVVKRNMSTTQLESMWASYSAGSRVPEQRVPPQFLLPSPNPKQASQPAIESKSVTWGTSGLGPRSILKKDHYESVATGATGAGAVVGAGSVSASGPVYGYEGYGVDQGVG